MKQLKINTPQQLKIKNFYLSIYNYIKTNSKLPGNDYLKFKKNWEQNRNYYVSELKKAKFIEKIGYGVWKTVKNFDAKQLKTTKKKITRDTPQQPGGVYKSLSIRGHSFIFKLKLPKIRNWAKREQYLKKKNIVYKLLKNVKDTHRIYFKGQKIWLSNRSIIIYAKSSYIADSASKTKNYALDDMFILVEALEALFKISFKIQGKYQFKVNKQHYARMQCELANQYRRDGKKLEVKQKDGTTWLWIDYSLNINETETGNTQRADIDMDRHIHPFLNSLRESPGYTPGWVINSIAALIEDRRFWAKHQKSHIKAIQILGSSVQMLKDEIKKFKNRLEQKKLTRWL